MVLPVVFALLTKVAPPLSSVERWLPMAPKWVHNKLSRPQSLVQKLQSRHVDIEAEGSSLRDQVLLVEVCRKHLEVSEFFTRWFRNVAVILVMGSLNPLVAAPVFVGSLIETFAYSAQLKVALLEIKSSSDKLHEVPMSSLLSFLFLFFVLSVKCLINSTFNLGTSIDLIICFHY